VNEQEPWPEADQTLDVTGLRCPIPIVKTARAMETLDLQNVLELLVDDQRITEDLPAWCEANAQTLIKLERGEQSDLYHGFIRKESSLEPYK